MNKLYSSKNTFENGWWGGGGASPMDLPMAALIITSLTTTPTSRFSFNMMRGKVCQICFEITARTVLAQFGHFTLKIRVRFNKGEFRPPPLGAPLPQTTQKTQAQLDGSCKQPLMASRLSFLRTQTSTGKVE